MHVKLSHVQFLDTFALLTKFNNLSSLKVLYVKCCHTCTCRQIVDLSPAHGSQCFTIIVVWFAVSSQDMEFRPHSLTTADVTMATAAMTTATTNGSSVGEKKENGRERVVSTLPPFPGDNGNNSGAAAAAYAGKLLCTSVYVSVIHSFMVLDEVLFGLMMVNEMELCAYNEVLHSLMP